VANLFDERCSYCNCRLPTHFGWCPRDIRAQPIHHIEPYGPFLNPLVDPTIKAIAEYPITEKKDG
jgi:hypothetical protein